MKRRRALILALGAICGLTGAAFGNAQPPISSVSAQSTTVDATPSIVVCTASPRAVDDLLATPTAEPGLLNIRQELPEGIAADAATAEAITRTVRELESCANSGEIFRFLALFTDAALRQRPIAGNQDARSELIALADATPVPISPGERVTIPGPWHIELLPDGRVAAAVIWFGNEADLCVDANQTSVLLLVQQNGRWLVDEIVEDVAGGELIDFVGPPPARAIGALDLCEDAGSERFVDDG